MVELEPLVRYLDDLLDTPGVPDYRPALNGLQVAGPPLRGVRRIAAAVDASEAVIADAVRGGFDLLVVHHGLFWSGSAPVTGRLYRKLKLLLDSGIALYASHLPLDTHPEVGNCILLANGIGLAVDGRFGSHEGHPLGWQGTIPATERATFSDLVAGVVRGPVRVVPGGPGVIRRAAVVTGAGTSFLEEAARSGIDALVTGEGPHHSALDAHEFGIDLFLAGHYATETFGVQAVSARAAEHFGIEWSFLDHPTGF